jgi:NodT family efflux transporter outer membrane factor (OMF) lipoprotein
VNPARRLPWLLAAAVALSACAHRRAGDVRGRIAVPDRYAQAAPEAAALPAAPDRWWTAFGEPALNEWIERAFAGNLSLGRAWARLEQARLAAKIAGADRIPTVNVEGSARRAQTIAQLPSGAFERTTSTFALGLAASYEVDLWGRVAATARAAAEDLRASRADLETAALTLAAETAEAWLSLEEQTAIRALIEGQLRASRDVTRLVEHRFGQGLSSALDVYQQRQLTTAIEALLPPVDARLAALRHQLAVLAGLPPGSAVPESDGILPDPPPPPGPGLPADLLRRRPDVAAAEARLRAADERTAAAIANRLPALRLGATGGTQSFDSAAIFDDWVWSLAGNLVGPLVDGGRRRAEADRAGAVRDEALDAFRLAVLQALREVEDALVLERRQIELIERLGAQRDAAGSTLAQARTSYVNGQAEYLSVLVALDRLQQTDRSLVAARRQRLAYRVQLHRALGGDWTRSLQRSTAREP